jgi:uncharacterized membrane protein YkoI
MIGACMIVPGVAPAQAGDGTVLLAQVVPRQGCLSRRDAIKAVMSGQARPLSDIRDQAENAASGEMISADICPQGGKLAYVVTVLSPSGKVAYVTLDAASGRLLNVRQ